MTGWPGRGKCWSGWSHPPLEPGEDGRELGREHSVLKSASREISTLSPTLLNRFLLLCVRRVRLLPEGGDPNPLKDTGLARYLASTLKHAQTTGPVKLAEPTRELWWRTYPQLTQPADGLTGQLTARAEAHTIRLALLYALLYATNTIAPDHLTAALALWDYAARSVAWPINHTTGDPLAEQIHAALARSPDGLPAPSSATCCTATSPPNASNKHSTGSPAPAEQPGIRPPLPGAPPRSGPPPDQRRPSSSRRRNHLLRRDGACLREGVARLPRTAGGMGTDETDTRTQVSGFGRVRSLPAISSPSSVTPPSPSPVSVNSGGTFS